MIRASVRVNDFVPPLARRAHLLHSRISLRKTEEPPGGGFPVLPVVGSFLSRGDEIFVILRREARDQIAFDLGERSLVCRHVKENGGSDGLPLQLARGSQSVPTEDQVVALRRPTHRNRMP